MPNFLVYLCKDFIGLIKYVADSYVGKFIFLILGMLSISALAAFLAAHNVLGLALKIVSISIVAGGIAGFVTLSWQAYRVEKDAETRALIDKLTKTNQ